jgi:5-methylcytosine-specific restriction protein A
LTKRNEFTDKVKKEIAKRANGRCEKCQAALKQGEGEADVDHEIMDALVIEKRKLTAADGQWLCKVCHKIKTADDLKRLAKAKRNEARHIGAVKPKGWSKPEKPQRTGKPKLPPRALYGAE